MNEVLCDKKGGILAVASVSQRGVDVLTDILNENRQESSTILATLQHYCNATAEGKFLPKKKCNSLGDGLLELKPKKLRLVFFVDENIRIDNIVYKKVAIFTNWFIKKTPKTPEKEIKKGLLVKKNYYADKKTGKLNFYTE